MYLVNFMTFRIYFYYTGRQLKYSSSSFRLSEEIITQSNSLKFYKKRQNITQNLETHDNEMHKVV